jgi:hypothetical protein
MAARSDRRGLKPKSPVIAALMVAVISVLPGCANIPEKTALTAFGSDAELRHYFRYHAPTPPGAGAPNQELPQGAPQTQAGGPRAGDIVEPFGDNLVILRHDQLLTVSIRGGGLRPVDEIDAYPPTASADGSFEDMLIVGNLVIVIGYQTRGILISRFEIDGDGHLQSGDAYELRMPNYDATNAFSWRATGDQLIHYSQFDLSRASTDPVDAIPALSRWDAAQGVRLATSREIRIPVILRKQQARAEALQMVIACNLVAPTVACSATGVLGPAAQSFYVSADAVYVWVEDQLRNSSARCEAAALTYRLPLDGSGPAVSRTGNPLCPK